MTPVTSPGSHRHIVHLYNQGRTACGFPVDADRWTVRAPHHVHDRDWCDRCWDRHYT